MAYQHSNPAQPVVAEFQPVALPAIRRIALADLRDVLTSGYDDFEARPSHVLLLGVLYPILGLVLARLAFGYAILPLLFPLAAGFALVGPLVAIGFYEISRQREAGLDASWRDALNVFRSPSLPAIVALGLLLLALFYAWLMAAETLYESLFGPKLPASLPVLLNQVFGTREGLWLILAGNAIGFVFAAAIFVISVVSFPLLLDRKESAAVAMLTSIRAVLANPGVMAVWAFVIAVTLLFGAIPFFLGLAVAVPILGHASWHLYRKVVAA